jgi:hypothetical protein
METTQASFSHSLRENPMGEACKDALRLDFDRRVKFEFHGTKVTSDAGLLAYRELDEVLGLTSTIDLKLRDIRTGKNNGVKIRIAEEKSLVGVRRKSVRMLDFQPNGVSWGHSGRRMGRIYGQKRWSRSPQCGIIDHVACKSTDYGIKWEIPD